MKIALVSCSKSKQCYPCKACEMYMPSSLFRYSYQYAKKYADKVYILSAKHGLLRENMIIEPYDLLEHNLPPGSIPYTSSRLINCR